MRHLSSVLLIVLVFGFSATAQQAQQAPRLQIVASAPRGITEGVDQSQTIFAVFNQPMTALQEAPDGLKSGPLLIEPRINGSYRWLGTSTIAFATNDTLPRATLFTVRIPKGTKSLNGQYLTEDFMWQFETLRPALAWTDPGHGDKEIELDQQIILYFNQPVNPSLAAMHISVEESVGGTVMFPAFTVKRAEKNERITNPEQAVVIVLTNRMKEGATYTVRCKQGLLGVEGPLGMAEEKSFQFSTYGDLVCEQINAHGTITPTEGIKITFSNSVKPKDVISHIVFEPKLEFSHDTYDENYARREIWLYPSLKAETEYTLRLLPGLTDIHGAKLKGISEFHFKTGSFDSWVYLARGKGVLESKAKHQLPVELMNATSVRIRWKHIEREKLVPAFLKEDQAAALFTEPYIVKSWTPKLPANISFSRPIGLDTVLQGKPYGIVLLGVTNTSWNQGQERSEQCALTQVTNLGITGKYSAESNLIVVTQLNDAAPVAGASVEVRGDDNKICWKGITDASGAVKTPGWVAFGLSSRNEYSEPRQWVIVEKDGDIAVSASDWNEGIQPWVFDVPYSWRTEDYVRSAKLFTDRGLYRAGEKVDIKGVCRIENNHVWQVPGDMDYLFTIKDSRENTVLEQPVRLSAYGSFATALETRERDPLGEYTMTLKGKRKNVQGDWEELTGGSFRLEAFRAAEFEVIARSEHESRIAGDVFKGHLSARYLFGAPMKKELASWRLSITPREYKPEGFDAYDVGPLSWLREYSGDNGYRLLASKQEKLNNDGMLTVESELRTGDIRGTQTLLFEADVTSPARRMISGRTSIVLHGGEYYIGLAPHTTFLPADSALNYKVVCVSPDGAIEAGHQVTVRVFLREWISVRKAESGGRYTWSSEEHDTVLDSAVVESSAQPLERKFKPGRAGFFYIRAEGADKRGNKLLTETYFYASGSSYVGWERYDDDRVQLVTDRKSYKPGETAHIIVKSPYESANVVITVERKGILQHTFKTLVGSAPQIDIPIEKNFLPNVYVSVVLLQGRKENQAPTRDADVGRPSVKVGYIAIDVSPLEKKLLVEVATDKPSYRPADSVTVTIRTKNREGAGVRAEVALSVADLGVLNLIGYRLPVLFDHFYKLRPLAVSTTDSRLFLIEQRSFGEKGENAGGGGLGAQLAAQLDAEGVRKDFRPSAYWSPYLITDDRGEITVRFKLPENITGFQAMAAAQTIAGEFGNGETGFTVNKPLLLQPAFPRFVRFGDTFEGGAVLINCSDSAKTVTLISGAVGVKRLDADTTLHVVKPGEAIEIRRKYEATQTGTAMVFFKVLCGNERDGFRIPLAVKMPGRKESVAFYTSSETGTNEKVIIPKEIHPELGSVDMSLSSTAMTGLQTGITSVLEYPYGCLEQRTSRVLVLLGSAELIKQFNLEGFKKDDLRSVVQTNIDGFEGFRTWQGGLAYWRGGAYASWYVSAYAAIAMTEAKRQGYTVDKKLYDGLLAYLREQLMNPARSYSLSMVSCLKAITLFALADAGKPDRGYAENLVGNYNNLPLFARAYLIRTLALQKADPQTIQKLAATLFNMAKVDPTTAHFEERDESAFRQIFSSTTRTTAMVLRTLVDVQPENPLAHQVVKWLLDRRSNGSWRTTQENYYAIDALTAYFRVYEKETPDFTALISFGGKTAAQDEFRGRSLKTAQAAIPMKDLTLGKEYPVGFWKNGAGRFYYGMRMNYFPKGATKPKEQGLTLLRSIEPLDQPGKPVTGTTFRAGSIYRVSLTVVATQERTYLAIDDPVPAGFEIVDVTMKTTASNLDEHSRRRYAGDEESEEPEYLFNHVERYDDRVLVFADYVPAGVHTFTYLVRAMSYGTFDYPAAQAGEMYAPEVFGVTGGKTIVVE